MCMMWNRAVKYYSWEKPQQSTILGLYTLILRQGKTLNIGHNFLIMRSIRLWHSFLRDGVETPVPASFQIRLGKALKGGCPRSPHS